MTATTAERQATLRRIEALAFWLDNAFTVPGTKLRFGLDPILGLLPGFGDAVGVAFSAYIIYEARQLGAPQQLVTMMIANAAVDALVGTVPVLGDLFDAGFKANARNIKLLKDWMARR